jgi:outer membrane immunogenic protein
MKRLLLPTLAGLVLAASSSAFAADLSAPSPTYKSPAPAYSWTGLYVGVDGGGAWTGSQNVSDVPCSTCATLPASGTLTGSSGFIGGIYAGYNFMVAPTWLVGIEGDWSWTQLNDNITAPQVHVGGVVIPPPQINAWSRDVRSLVSLRGRLAGALTPTTLLYVTGGLAWSSVDYSAQDIFVNTCPNCALTAFNQANAGYVVGGGAEWAPWSNNWIVRAEYLYYHFDGASSTVGIINGPALPVTFSWGALSIQEVRAGIGYKFQ